MPTMFLTPGSSGAALGAAGWREAVLTVTLTSGEICVCIAASTALTSDRMNGSVGLSNTSVKLTESPSMRMSSSTISASMRFLPLPG